MIDNIFGDLMDDEVRTTRCRANAQGVKHRNQITPSIPTPDQALQIALTTSGPLPFDAAACWFSCERGGTIGNPPAEAVIYLMPGAVRWDDATWDYVRRWTAELPPQPAGTLLRYRLAARVAGSDTWVFADNQARSAAAATEFAVVFDATGVPAWARAAVVYHVFIDRFFPGHGKSWQAATDLAGFFGGTLRGVIQKLDYIQALGCNTLWLSPLFASPSHHGYDATDYYQVEPRLGTNADLKELIDRAHAQGLHVILDFVANHWSRLNPIFQAALADEASPYHEWYTWHRWPDDYESYFNVRDLPQLNLRRGPARDYLLACARYWLQAGVDGYRLDFASGPPLDFWTDFRQACRAARADCWLFGEVIHTPETQAAFAGRLDGTLDFLLARALRETFARDNWRLDQFEAFLAGHEAYFPPDFLRPSFLDNHDMNRFLFLAGGQVARLKLAALALFTLAGPPILYYGTEVGVTQTRPIHLEGMGLFEVARMPMKWGEEQDDDLLAFFRRLVDLRRHHPVLLRGMRRVLHLDAEAGTYAYLRSAAPDRYIAGDVLAAFNLSAEPRCLHIPLAAGPAAADRLSDQVVRPLDDGLEVRLAPLSGAFIA